MMKVKDVLHFLETKFPLVLASDFDQGKLGLQIGNLETKVERIIVALDVTEMVIDEAINEKAELIISHHPFLFNPVLSINYQEPLGRKLLKVIKNNLNIICMHTNIDVSNNGMNDYLAALLKLNDVNITTSTIDKTSFLRTGTINKKILREYAYEVSKVFGEDRIRVVGNLDKTIHKVGIVGGSGSSLMKEAKNAGCDCFITGEIKHNHALEALEMDLALIEISHNIENLFMKKLVNDLKITFPNLIFMATKTQTNPFIILSN